MIFLPCYNSKFISMFMQMYCFQNPIHHLKYCSPLMKTHGLFIEVFQIHPDTQPAFSAAMVARNSNLEYYLGCKKNKGADQLVRKRRLICAFVFRLCKNRFSHDATQLKKKHAYVTSDSNIHWDTVDRHFTRLKDAFLVSG